MRKKLFPYRTLVKDPAWHDYDDIAVERVVMSQPDLPATVLRLPVVYGPEDYYFHRVFPYLRRMDDGRPAILLDTERASHRDSRVYVEDAAWAIALAATDERAKGRIYNIAPTRTLTEVEWVEAIARAAAWHGKVVRLPRERLPKHLIRDLDYRHDLSLSSERIRNELAYSERIPFEIGLQKTVEWQRANPPAVQPDVFDYEAEDAVLQAIGI